MSSAPRFEWLSRLLAPCRGSLLPLIGGLVFSFAYFVGAPAWNQNSRFALTRAIVEEGTVAIDSHHQTTGDKSFRDGHFYCDKAPGVSVFAVLPHAAGVVLRRTFGGDTPSFAVQSLDPKVRDLGTILEPEDRLPGDRIGYSPSYRFALYLCTFFVVVLPTALLGGGGVFLLARSMLQTPEDDRHARIVALVFGLGTPIWVYSTALYGHALCGALLIAAFAILELAPKASHRSAPLAAGMLLGAAVFTEYPAAVVAVLAVAYAAFRRGPRDAAWVAAGGLPWALGLAGYHVLAFGGPLSTGYDFVYREEFARGMAVRYGLGTPAPEVALSLLFGSFRGLFYLSPVLLLAAWGTLRGLRRPDSRRVHLAALIVFIYFWLLNAGYYMWDGGASAGPRHMIPSLGFLVLGLVPALATVPRATAILGCVSVGQALLLASASPEVAQSGDPLWEFAIGRLLEATPSAGAGHTNVGLLLGLPGPLSLLPLLAVWAWLLPRLRLRKPVRNDPARKAQPSAAPTSE